MSAPRAAAVVLAVVLVLTGCTSQPDPASSTHAAPAPTSSSATQAHAGNDVDEHDAHDEEVDAPALPAWDEPAQANVLSRAEGFVRAWARPDLDTTSWFAGVQGFLTPAAAEGFLWTDPGLVPATAVTGSPVLIEGTATSATVRVPTDAGEHDVLLVHPDESTAWLVVSLTPVDVEQVAP